jgi:type II secretory pathway component PulC
MAKIKWLALIGCVSLSSMCVHAAEQPAAKPAESRAVTQKELEAAQRRLDAAAREVARLSQSLSEGMMPDVMFRQALPHRAMLGINLGPRHGSNREDGVDVASVSPGGAADQAGLKAGDVLTQINGKPLTRSSDSSARDKLLQEMQNVDPGQQVKLQYRRDGKLAAVMLTAQPVRDILMAMPPDMPLPPVAVHAPGFRFFTHRIGAFGDLELVSLTPKLGKYFGTDQGLLVVRAPAEAKLPIEEGDVIQDIDGRKPTSPSHAMRILSSYQGGEKIKIGVLRDHRRMSIDTTAPEGNGDMEFERGMPPPPPGTRARPGFEGATFEQELPDLPLEFEQGSEGIAT